MTLLDVLTHFGFDTLRKTRMARHRDTRRGVDFAALLNTDQFEEYQKWQLHPVFHNADFVISFIGDGAGRARFWGIYAIRGHVLVPYDQLPNPVPWPWDKDRPCHCYDLVHVSGYEPLVDRLVIEWSGERSWSQHLKAYRVVECPPLHDIDLPAWNPMFAEGRSFTKLVVSKQRSREAREQCLTLHGCKCAVCGMTFPEQYGGLGTGFMHVHHLTSVASKEGEYDVSPKTDLKPVCPNCHAMLHWNVDTPRSIDELRQFMDK